MCSTHTTRFTPVVIDDSDDEEQREPTEIEQVNAKCISRDFAEVQLYSQVASEFPGLGARMLQLALAPPFALVSKEERDFDSMLADFTYRTNYEIKNVVHVHNPPRRIMWEAMRDAYKIGNSTTVYHGTTHKTAESIAKHGFKASASQRSLYGKGCYVAKNFLEAAGYANANEDEEQVVLVCELLVGPCAIGSNGQQDFGYDANGNAILTLTNADQTIMCASQETQLLVVGYITIVWQKHVPWDIRFNTNNPWLNDVHRRRYLLPKPAPAPQSAAPVPAPAPRIPPPAPARRRMIKKYKGFSVGQEIRVVVSPKCKKDPIIDICDGHNGELVAIRKNNDGIRVFYVQMHDADIAKKGEAFCDCLCHRLCTDMNTLTVRDANLHSPPNDGELRMRLARLYIDCLSHTSPAKKAVVQKAQGGSVPSYKDIAVGQKIRMTKKPLPFMQSEECVVVDILKRSMPMSRGKNAGAKMATRVFFLVRPVDKDTLDLLKAWNKKNISRTAAHAPDVLEIRRHHMAKP